MMKNTIGIAAATALALSTAALAGDDPPTPTPTEWFSIGDLVLGAGEGTQVAIQLPDNESLVVGFEVRFDYSEAVEDASWASDVQVIVTAPDQDIYTVGGLTNLPAADIAWSFQGPQSNGPGTYGDSGLDAFLPWLDNGKSKGEYLVDFTNDWLGDPNPNQYDNVEIRFYKVPGPGALALLGFAALAGRRRRH